MKSYKDLVKYYLFFNQWSSFLKEVLEENESFFPYSYQGYNVFKAEEETRPSNQSITDIGNKYFEGLKSQFFKRKITNPNTYSLIEKEITEIRSSLIGNTYYLDYTHSNNKSKVSKEDSYSYELSSLRQDLEQGKIRGGNLAIYLLSDILGRCKYWDWLHSEEVSKFYYHFLTRMLFLSSHEIEKIVCPKAFSNSTDENTPIKDFLMIEVILAFGHTTREIVTNLRQYKETLSDIEKEFFNTDVLDMAHSFFLNNSTSINYIENAHSKKSEESKKEIYHRIKSAFPIEQLNYTKTQSPPVTSIQSQTSYTWLLDTEKLDLLYQSTLNKNLIAPNTLKEDFKNVFSKKELTTITTIDWTDDTSLLAYFISELIKNKYISKGTGFWKIAEACFPKHKNLKQAKDQYLNNKSGLPRGYKKINAILKAFTSQ